MYSMLSQVEEKSDDLLRCLVASCWPWQVESLCLSVTFRNFGRCLVAAQTLISFSVCVAALFVRAVNACQTLLVSVFGNAFSKILVWARMARRSAEKSERKIEEKKLNMKNWSRKRTKRKHRRWTNERQLNRIFCTHVLTVLRKSSWQFVNACLLSSWMCHIPSQAWWWLNLRACIPKLWV